MRMLHGREPPSAAAAPLPSSGAWKIAGRLSRLDWTGLDCIDLGQHQDAAALESDRLTMLAANVAVIVVIVVAAVTVAATAAAGCVILNNGASNCNSNSFRT